MEFVGGHALHRREHLLHLGAAGDDVRIVVAFAELLAERAVFFAQPAHVEFFVNDHAHFGERKWLQHVIAGAGFHRLDRGFNRAEGGHYDYGEGGVGAFYGVEKF